MGVASPVGAAASGMNCLFHSCGIAMQKLRSMACHDRQSFDSPETGSRAPANARILYGQLELRPTLEQGS